MILIWALPWLFAPPGPTFICVPAFKAIPKLDQSYPCTFLLQRYLFETLILKTRRYNCRRPPCHQPGCQYNGFKNQTLVFEPFSEGEIRLHFHELPNTPAEQKFCVEAPAAQGGAVTLALCSDSPKQSWWLTNDQHIAATGSGMCLDVKDGSLWDSGSLQVYSCASDNNNQLFEVIGFDQLPYSYEW